MKVDRSSERCEVAPAPAWLGVVLSDPTDRTGAVWLADGFEPWPVGSGFFFVGGMCLGGRSPDTSLGRHRPMDAPARPGLLAVLWCAVTAAVTPQSRGRGVLP